MSASPLENVSAIKSYLDRIGAQFTSIFRAVVSAKVSGYEKDVAVIRFTRDGTVRAEGGYPPTPQEAEAIQVAMAGMDLPKPLRLAGEDKSNLPEAVVNARGEDVFTFRSRTNQIIMYQVRVDLDNGDKKYVPWTYWSDGVWRRAEPDGALPIYGMELAVDASRIFIHEGAKAAKAAQEISRDTGHPWSEFMSTGVHVGWIGGVHQVARGDWDQLRRASPDDVIIVPDNDAPGARVVPNISRHFTCRTSVVIWDGDWPSRFDLADAMPKKFYKNGLWIGPNMQDLLHPAEWCTDQFPNPEGRGRPIVVPRDAFLDRWHRIERTKSFCPKDNPIRVLDRENFNAYMKPYSHVSDVAGLFMGVVSTPIEQQTFSPDTNKSIIRVGNRIHLNQYTDMRVKPAAGDTKIFHEFIEYLVPGQVDRDNFMRWIRTLYACPAIRMGYGILALSEQQGVGKSTIGTILSHMIGKEQVSFPGDAMIQSDFNGWIVNKRLIVVNEIYAGQNWRTYNSLKSMVTDPEIDANVKHQATYQTANWAHFYCCSNSMEAMRIEDSDRRWFVPKITELLWPKPKYDQLYAWMADGGLNAIANEFVNSSDYEAAGGRAPGSIAKSELVENSRPPEHEFVVSLMDKLRSGQAMDISDAWVFIKDIARSPYLTTQRVSHMAKTAGFGVSKQKRVLGRRRRLLFVTPEEMELAMDGDNDLLASSIVSPESVWADSTPM